MASAKKRTALFRPEISDEIESKLRQLAEDPNYNTAAGYSTNSVDYPDGKIPFADKHMKYLRTNSAINPYHYVANLRIMTRIR